MRSDCAGADDWQWRHVIALGVWCRCRRNLSLSQGVWEDGLMLGLLSALCFMVAALAWLCGKLQKQVDDFEKRLSLTELHQQELWRKTHSRAIDCKEREATDRGEKEAILAHFRATKKAYENNLKNHYENALKSRFDEKLKK
jgi:hypothetical protein